MSLVDSSIDCGVHQRIKRKLDDYVPTDDDDFSSDLISVRMRKDDPDAVNSSASPDYSFNPLFQPRVSDLRSTRGSELQFFVRMISDYKTLVIQANTYDTVRSVHEKIHSITGIPVIEQRLIYRGKQLQWDQSLAESKIQNDAGLQLVGRMRSTGHPQAWQLIDQMVSDIFRMCKGEVVSSSELIKPRLMKFLSNTPRNDNEQAAGYLQIFRSSSAPAALAMLYMSRHEGHKEFASDLIREFVSSINMLPKSIHNYCAPILLEFCKLLRSSNPDDVMNNFCRHTLGSMLGYVAVGGGATPKSGDSDRDILVFQDIFPFVRELAAKLNHDLTASIESKMGVGSSLVDVSEFSAFLLPLRNLIKEQVTSESPITMPFREVWYNAPCYWEEIKCLYGIFFDLLEKMDLGLCRVEEFLGATEKGESAILGLGWFHYLDILKELNNISKLYEGAEDQFWQKLNHRKVSVRYLIIRYAKRSDDNGWILEHKEVTNFECRRHLALMLLPELKDDYEELHEMLIDRSQLLAESFEYIARAETDTLRAGLFLEFKNEDATGPGVLREWFFLVCQAIFNPQNALFVACPNDRRRFFPNPASKVDPLHLEYFTFSGRVIALALMHKVQVGIVFDRVFFLQLTGLKVSLEDIQDADPLLYSSCKKILAMDPETVDQDALGLTFVRDVDEIGSTKVEELCPGGKYIVVNSCNRREYVDRLIQHRFVTSTRDQVTHFARGFTDIMGSQMLRYLFFQSLELEDLDWMLHGSESAISVEDWKAHTEYNGYEETDPQIYWFWKAVEEMSAEKRKVLLFFWTSVKYLPVEGFRGLASPLFIYRSTETEDRLPSSHTCFYRLCFPPYSSFHVMQDRLHLITQEHVGCSFGTF